MRELLQAVLQLNFNTLRDMTSQSVFTSTIFAAARLQSFVRLLIMLAFHKQM